VRDAEQHALGEDPAASGRSLHITPNGGRYLVVRADMALEENGQSAQRPDRRRRQRPFGKLVGQGSTTPVVGVRRDLVGPGAVAPPTWCDAELPAERPRERLVALEPGFEGDLEDRRRPDDKQDGRPLEAQALDIGARRLADRGRERPGEVARRHAGQASQTFELQVVV